MLVKDFITKELPVLKSFDTGEYALSLMDDFKLRHLPLVTDGVYQSLISEKDLHGMPGPKAAIGEMMVFAPSVSEEGHIYEVMAIICRYCLSILPVVDGEGKYVGAITHERMIEAIAGLCSADLTGSIIVLEMFPQDYSLSDIARIAESNNAQVLNLFSYIEQDSGRLIVTMKINLEDASPVIRSFERFNYTVSYHFMETGVVDEVLQQRMNELMYYMNM